MGVEIAMEMDGAVMCRTCALTLGKNSLTIGEKREFRGTIEEVLASLPGNKSVAISLTGRGILTKKSKAFGVLSGQQLQEIFPNFKAESFYVQQFPGDDHVFVSIARKEQIDELLEELAHAKIQLLCMTLGPFAVSHVLSQVNTYGEQLCFAGHCVSYAEEFKWRDYKFDQGRSSEFTLKIAQEHLGEEYLIAYATAFQLILYPRLSAVLLPVSKVSDRLEDLSEQQKFRFRLVGILGFFFVLLLVNFLVFSNYRAENESLYTRVNLQSSSAETLQILEKMTAQQQEQLKALGWYHGLPYSWLTDQVSSEIPFSVELTELSISPIKAGESNSERKEIYQSGKISIKGITADPAAVNDWIYKLKSRNWVQHVQMQRFSPGEEEGVQEFEMLLNY